jgi:hypothetical protein
VVVDVVEALHVGVDVVEALHRDVVVEEERHHHQLFSNVPLHPPKLLLPQNGIDLLCGARHSRTPVLVLVLAAAAAMVTVVAGHLPPSSHQSLPLHLHREFGTQTSSRLLQPSRSTSNPSFPLRI